MSQFQILSGGKYKADAGKALVHFVNEYTPIRNDFILFFQKVIRSGLKFEFEILVFF